MDLITVVLIGLGLAMDAFAVSVCKGMAMKAPSFRATLIVALWFGGFQFIMPVIGYLLGDAVYGYISDYDHWIAFGLLLLIGVGMIREGLSGDDEDVDAEIGFRTMLILAVATSIDALAIGISFAMTEGDILGPAAVVGIVTFLVSAVGVRVGGLFGSRLGGKAELLGGAILIAIGAKILLEHTGLLRGGRKVGLSGFRRTVRRILLPDPR